MDRAKNGRLLILDVAMAKSEQEFDLGDLSTNRRRFLGGSAAAVLGLGAIAGGSGAAIDAVSAQGDDDVDTPLGWEPVDVDEIEEIARDNYYAGMHCGEGVFATLVDAQRQQGNSGWDDVPTIAAYWGAGGGGGNGALCGTIIGGSMVAALAHGRSDTTMKLVNEIHQRYMQEPFPIYEPPGDTEHGTSKELPQNRAKSPLCHVSVTKWCKVSGYEHAAEERAERCSRVASDMTLITARLLNAEAEGNFEKVANEVPHVDTIDPEKGCVSCHSTEHSFEEGGYVSSKMACDDCHGMAPHMPDSLKK